MQKEVISGILFFMLLSITTTAFSQQLDSPAFTPKPYLIKSKNQKKAAKALLISGGALMLGSVAIAAPGNVSFDDVGTLVTTAAIGAVAALGSIPLFIASSKNEKRAHTVLACLKKEQLFLCSFSGKTARAYPSVAIRVRL